MARALEGSELLFLLLPARQKPVSALLLSCPPETNTQKVCCCAGQKRSIPDLELLLDLLE
jgi:hypothetical protein